GPAGLWGRTGPVQRVVPGSPALVLRCLERQGARRVSGGAGARATVPAGRAAARRRGACDSGGDARLAADVRARGRFGALDPSTRGGDGAGRRALSFAGLATVGVQGAR